MESEPLPRKLAAIFYADVAGYSRLTGEDEDWTHRRLSEYLDLISTCIERHRGQVMHYAGDAVLAKFDAVVDALSSAVAVQNKLKDRNEDLPDERKVQFRIGVNLGDVIEDRGDIYGDGVNVAARLESLAEPGGICISESVQTAVGNKLPFDYQFMGEQEVKNIAKPVKGKCGASASVSSVKVAKFTISLSRSRLTCSSTDHGYLRCRRARRPATSSPTEKRLLPGTHFCNKAFCMENAYCVHYLCTQNTEVMVDGGDKRERGTSAFSRTP